MKMIRHFMGCIREYKKPTVLTLLCMVGEVAIEVLIPFFTANLVNEIKNGAALGGVVRVGNGAAPHILSISLVGYPSANVVTELGAQGICISAGSACHRGQLSHVYRAMGLDKKTAAGVLRVSFGPETTKEEIDALAKALKAHRDTRFPML